MWLLMSTDSVHGPVTYAAYLYMSASLIGRMAIRAVLGLVLLASGVGKLIDPSDAGSLVDVVMGSDSFFASISTLIVVAVSVVELVLVAWLAWGKYLGAALLACLGLVGVFTVVVGSIVMSGQGVATCGCFGAFGLGFSAEWTLMRNLGLLAIILTGLLLNDST
jgi:hypothetical protein